MNNKDNTEVLIKDLVILAHNTYQLLQVVTVPKNKAKDLLDLEEACLNVLKTFTMEYNEGDEGTIRKG